MVIDATGLGASPASWLSKELGKDRVEQILFTGPAKSRIGFNLLAMCGTGRCRMYTYDGEDQEVRSHYARYWREVEVARYELRYNEQLSYGVPAKEGHDDYLMSAALLCWAAAAAPAAPASGIIPPHTPGEGETRHQSGRPWHEVY